MRVYVDDLRRCPDGWTLARTNTEAIRLLATGYVEEISCDHDIVTPFSGELSASVRRRLQIGQETFQPVAYYICAMKPEDRPKIINFHTANTVAGERMVALLKDAGIESTCNETDYSINWDEIESEHDGSKSHCGCDCKGCLGMIPDTNLYKINQDLSSIEHKWEGEF